jgi:hypothetical protein
MIAMTDLVAPQEGQGMPVICLNKQTPSTPDDVENSPYKWTYNQAYPAIQAVVNKPYTLWRWTNLNIKIVEVFPYSFPWLRLGS